MTNETTALYIAKALAAEGCTTAGIAGVLGNLEAESGVVPCRMQGDFGGPDYQKSLAYASRAMTGAVSAEAWAKDAVGFGLAQWTYWTRKLELLSDAKNAGQFVGDVRIQTSFLIKELKRDYAGVWALLTNPDATVTLCSNAMLLKYERPADMSEGAQRQRCNLSVAWFNWLQNLTGDEDIPAQSVAQGGSQGPQSAGNTETAGLHLRTIQKGLNWEEVWLLEALLKLRGYNVLHDGMFSEGLAAKVKEFQKDCGLADDGIVGPNTWKALGVIV